MLSWAIVPTVEPVQFHRSVREVLDDAAEPSPYHVPGRWSPHLGPTRRLAPEDVSLAHTALGRHPDLTGIFTAARSFDSETRPTRPLGVVDGDPG
ncbi:hypothetical protein [Kitasatospora purpeofusca]|uniref:hypothetical protein n=1 Tax=Kitasatospora purpeofusca TaxID=67352 RepID=UPI0037F1E746